MTIHAPITRLSPKEDRLARISQPAIAVAQSLHHAEDPLLEYDQLVRYIRQVQVTERSTDALAAAFAPSPASQYALTVMSRAQKTRRRAESLMLERHHLEALSRFSRAVWLILGSMMFVWGALTYDAFSGTPSLLSPVEALFGLSLLFGLMVTNYSLAGATRRRDAATARPRASKGRTIG